MSSAHVSPALPRPRPTWLLTSALWTARIGLGALFLVAGVLKLRDPTAFATEIANYRLLPELAPYLAVVLPPVEIAIGLAMVAPPDAWRRAGAACASALLFVFTIAVTSAVARGMDVSCGCFGGASESVTWLTVARDVALLAAAVTLVVFPRAPHAATHAGSREGDDDNVTPPLRP